MIEEIRNKIASEEFDYQSLLGCLKTFDHPRDKITKLLRQGHIIRVKKGIYVFGKSYARRPHSREILANMLYGPSYVSLDYALSYHGLIPERVETVTSVTNGRSRKFSTPLGLFTYHHIPMKAYPIGFDQFSVEGGRLFFMATPEKALADKIQADRGTNIRSQTSMKKYLLTHLRIDKEKLEALDPKIGALIAKRYHSQKIRLLSRLIGRMNKQGQHHE